MEITFTVSEIEWMATGGVIVKDGINYCLSNGVMLYSKDMDHDIWHSFNGLKGV